MPFAILADSIHVERGGRKVISGVSLRVAAGEALLLVGPNGAGKTTLLRTLAGLLRPRSGRVAVEGGVRADGEPPEIGDVCHVVGHLDAVKPAFTVRENLAFWADYLGGTASDVARALERLALAELAEVPAGYLSAGQRRRLALARLLSAPRPVWLLDEPTVSLDARSVAAFARIVDEHVAAGGIAVAATHVPLGLANGRELRLGEAGPAT